MQDKNTDLNKMQELLDQIKKMIDRYESKYKTMTIPTLLDASDWFSIQATRLAEFLADFKHDYNEKYYIRKLKVAQQEQHLVNSRGFNITEAKSQAVVDTAQFNKAELDAQSFAYRIEILLKQINILIQTIQQRISYLKIEQKNSDYQNKT